MYETIYVRLIMKQENVIEDKKSKKGMLKKVGNILFYIVLGIFFILACFSITTRITKGKIGNSQFLVVVSSSMDGEQQDYDIKTIPVKSLVKVELISKGKENEFYSSLKKGDVLTFNYLSYDNETITHRIVKDPVLMDDGIYSFTLRGDAVGENSTQTLYSDGRTGEILGKVTFVSLPLGQIYFFITSKVGTLVLVALPCAAICIIEITKIIYMVSENKRKQKEEKIKQEQDEKDKEIKELKRQLEEAKKKE